MGVVQESLRHYIAAVAVLTAIALIVVSFRAYGQHLHYPYNNLLFMPWERLSDMNHYAVKCAAFAAGQGFYASVAPTWIYPAPSAYLQCFLLNDTAAAALILNIASATIVGAAVLVLWRAVKKCGHHVHVAGAAIAVTLVTSYPLAYNLDRANLEVIMMGFVFVFIVAFAKERYWAAAFAVACAASIKPYPTLFFMLLLFRRRFRETGAAIAAYGALNLIALAGFGTPIVESYRGIQDALKNFIDTRVVAVFPTEFGFDHSAFALIKRVAGMFTSGDFEPFRPYYVPYFFAMAIAGAVSLWRVRRLPTLNQFFVLTLITVFFPFVAYDYNLIELYLPWGLFLLFLAQQKNPPIHLFSALLILLPCAVAFTPQSFLFAGESGFGGQIKAVALIVLFATALVVPMPSRIFGELEGSPAPQEPDLLEATR
jgi:hypothetical protein